MGSRLAFGIFALASAVLRAQTAPAAASPCISTPSYSPCEMVFSLGAEDAAAHPNPYASVELTVTFRSPRQHSYPLAAYWDGSKRLVVRFSPTEVGNWDYLVTSNIATWNQQRGSFYTAPSASRGVFHPAALHHWAYTEKPSGLDQGHLWMGVSEPGFAFMDDAACRAVVDARAAQKFTHLRVSLAGSGSDPSPFPGPHVPNTAVFAALHP